MTYDNQVKNRLKRIEGQVRGIKKMVENDTYCTDILVQVSAVNAALNSFNKVLLANHLLANQRKNNPVYQDRLKNFSNIQVQTEPPEIGRMKIPDPRVQMGFIDFTQYRRINNRIAKTDQRIHFILGWPF